MILKIFQNFSSEEYCVFIDLGNGTYKMIAEFDSIEAASKYMGAIANATINNLD